MMSGATNRPGDGAPDRADALLAALAAGLAFSVYLATLYPGLHDVGDAAKFSFVGKLLGTPHPPGYPLYVMVSHLFSYVPWGTLAYRMNALSAVFGAVAVALSYLIVRHLGASRAVALAAALGLAFGAAFWSRALYAKGYTLNAALVAAGVLALLRWDRTRRMRDLYIAAGIFALSLGNHLIVVALVPALVMFPLLTEPRRVLRLKTIAIVLLLVTMGLAQYGFIMVRTHQRALYLEAKADTVSDLWNVMTARRFGHEIGAFSRGMLVSERLPHVMRMVGRELGPLGVPLMFVGLAALAVRRPRWAVLFGLGAAGVAGLTANMGSQEDEGFMLPVFVLLWPVAGVGLAAVTSALCRRPGTMAAGVVALASIAVPSSLIAANYAANDRHTQTQEIEYFDALFAALPGKAAIIDDEYRINMMVLYKLLGEGAAGERDIRLITQDRNQIGTFHRNGFEVLAFEHARHDLKQVGFRFVPFESSLSEGARIALRRRPVFRLLSEPVCFDVGNLGWVDVSPALQPAGRIAVRIDNYRPFDSRVIVYAGMPSRREIALAGQEGAGSPSVETEFFDQSDPEDRRRLQVRRDEDGAPWPEALVGAPVVVRCLLQVNDKGAYFSSALDFGGAVDGAVVRALVDLDNPRRATVCSHPLADVDVWPSGVARVGIDLEGTDAGFRDGWHALERFKDGRLFRWTSDRATLVLPMASPRPATLTMIAEPLHYGGRPPGTTIALTVNDRRVGELPLQTGWGRYSWTIDAEQWRNGLNNVVFEVSGARRPSDVGLSQDQRLLGVSVTGIEIAEQGTVAR